MITIDAETFISVPPIHRAIDQASALKIELYRMRRDLRSGTAIDGGRSDWMDRVVDQLAISLIQCRDECV